MRSEDSIISISHSQTDFVSRKLNEKIQKRNSRHPKSKSAGKSDPFIDELIQEIESKTAGKAS